MSAYEPGAALASLSFGGGCGGALVLRPFGESGAVIQRRVALPQNTYHVPFGHVGIA
jgi:hypothetical protein